MMTPKYPKIQYNTFHLIQLWLFFTNMYNYPIFSNSPCVCDIGVLPHKGMPKHYHFHNHITLNMITITLY